MRALLTILMLAAGAAPVARLDPDPWSRPPTRSVEVRRELAAAIDRGDRRTVTLNTLNLLRMGATLPPESQARLVPWIDPQLGPRVWRSPDVPLAQRLASAFAYNARSDFGDDEAFAAVPAEHRLIEGIAWDEATSRLFVGSVIDRRLLVREGETWREIPLSGPAGGIFGMAVDTNRRLLWLASAAAEPMPQPETAFSGLVAVDLERLAEARRIPVPGARLGDVALASDGTLYASDGHSGAIYRCRPGCAEAETLIPPGLLRSPQGMVVWPGDRLLYVADYSLGLMRIDLDSLRIRPLVARQAQMLDGIDGLLRFNRELVAIQNGTLPRRIIRIVLNPGGRIVEEVKLVEQNLLGWGEPTLGTLAAGALIYVADGQWERYGPGGALIDGAPQRPTAIHRTMNLWDIILTLNSSPPTGLETDGIDGVMLRRRGEVGLGRRPGSSLASAQAGS